MCNVVLESTTKSMKFEGRRESLTSSPSHLLIFSPSHLLTSSPSHLLTRLTSCQYWSYMIFPHQLLRVLLINLITPPHRLPPRDCKQNCISTESTSEKLKGHTVHVKKKHRFLGEHMKLFRLPYVSPCYGDRKILRIHT